MMTLIQCKVEEDVKDQAVELFKEIGIDLSSAIRIFLIKCIRTGGIPFEVTNDIMNIELYKLLKEIQRYEESIGNSNITLEEINEEIRLAREERRAREAKEKEGKN